jgi:hypothetical protein
MRKLQSFEMSAYDPGVTRPTVGTRYTLNGLANVNFKTYQNAYDDSPTNSFIIKTIVNYIVGDGLIDKAGLINPHDYLSEEDLRLICFDFKLHGSANNQIINANGKVLKMRHLPVERVGLNIDINPISYEYMEVNGYWYCWNYERFSEFPPRFIAKFKKEDDFETYQIQHIKSLSSEPYYPFPDWFSGLKAAKIESALIDDAVNHVLNGFQGKTIINVNGGSMMTIEEKAVIAKEVKDDYTGTTNSGGVSVSVNDSADEAIIVDTIEPRGRNDQFVTYDETSEIKLMAAHQAMNILFARPGSSGFSSNADEIATATDSFYLGVINPMRKILLNNFNQVFKKINPASEIDFVNFGQEKVIVTDATEATGLVDEVLAGADEATLAAQAQLKGSVGGVTALLSIQASYGQGLTTRESAISMLDLIFGYNKIQAEKLLGQPKITDAPAQTIATKEEIKMSESRNLLAKLWRNL